MMPASFRACATAWVLLTDLFPHPLKAKWICMHQFIITFDFKCARSPKGEWTQFYINVSFLKPFVKLLFEAFDVVHLQPSGP